MKVPEKVMVVKESFIPRVNEMLEERKKYFRDGMRPVGRMGPMGATAGTAGNRRIVKKLCSDPPPGEYVAYKARACFFNATRRASGAFAGLVFRKAVFVRQGRGGTRPYRG